MSSIEALTLEARKELLQAMGPHEYVHFYLRKKYGNHAAAAKAIGIGQSTLSMMLKGERLISPEVLLACGMKRSMTYELISTATPPTPAGKAVGG